MSRSRERRINRYYDPTTGQFVSVDPMVNETGQAYVYTGDDPINGLDPNGTVTFPSWLPGGGVVTNIQHAGAEIAICVGRWNDGCGSSQGIKNAVAGFANEAAQTFDNVTSAISQGRVNPNFSVRSPNNCPGLTGSYQLGEALFFGVGLVVPGGDEADAGNAVNDIGNSLDSTGRTVAMNLNEQLAMRQAVVDPASGTRLPFVMGDSRWPASEGWIKMSQNNLGVEIHYVYNVETGASADFKFVP